MTAIEKKANIVHGYSVLADKLNEAYLGLTVSQVQDLERELEATWRILERRKVERRGV